ncbi:MAG: hypothetical protein KIS79_07380 [Burkholderiales bacterium]|nr:hypothetical protein [Burkholderiales bacterium]
MRTALNGLILIAMLAIACAVAAEAPKPTEASGELALARELIAQREQLERMKLDGSVSRDALLAQERQLMEVRSRLVTALAAEMARQSTDSEQWRQAWESMKGFLRDKLRHLLDEPPAGPART